MTQETRLQMKQIVEDVQRKVRDELEHPSDWWYTPDTLVRNIADQETPQNYAALLVTLESDFTLFTDEPDEGGTVAQVIMQAIYERLVEAGNDEVRRWDAEKDAEMLAQEEGEEDDEELPLQRCGECGAIEDAPHWDGCSVGERKLYHKSEEEEQQDNA